MYGDFVKKFDDESRDKGSNDKLNPIYPDDDYRDSNNPIDDVDDNSDHENS